MYNFFFLVTYKFSEAMCKLIKTLLINKIVNPSIIMEKLPMNQLMNLLTSSVSKKSHFFKHLC